MSCKDKRTESMNEYQMNITDAKTSECEEIWSKCVEIIKDNLINELQFNIWIAPIKAECWENQTLTILVPSHFYAEYVDANFGHLLVSALRKIAGPAAQLMYNIMVVSVDETKVKVSPAQPPVTEFNPFVSRVKPKIDSQLNPNYTFETLVEGTCNKLAKETGLSVAANPNKNTFNPLFIYGGSGLGKTHISHAIGWEVMKRHPEKVVLYVDANRFQQQYSDAHLSNKVNDFLNFYQQIDVLIVDDIQFFSNKVGTQNVFFQIFNHLQQIGKQIILTSDRSPKHLQGLDERILSRFRWGVTVELTSPNQDTREAILQYKVNKGGLQIPDTVVRYIAENVQDNIRELEGVLNSLLAQSTFTQDEINISLAEKVVSRIVNVADRVVSIQSIQKMVCDYYRLDTKDIQTKSRRREVVQARQIAMYLSRKYTKNSLSTIGEQIGNRDHATVLYACKAVADLLKYDKSFRQSVENIESALS